MFLKKVKRVFLRKGSRKLFIVTRQSPDWLSFTEESFKEHSENFCRLIGRPLDQVYQNMLLWNKTFGISYFEARHKIKEVAQQNLSKIKGATIIPFDIFVQNKITSGYYLFVDDDDWFDPLILQTLIKYSPENYDAFVWGSVVLGGHNEEIIFYRNIDYTFHTNCYGISSNYLQQDPANIDKIYQHWGAMTTVQNQVDRVAKIPKYLSLTNKNPASTLFLEEGFKKYGQSSESLKKLVQDFNKLFFTDLSVLTKEIPWSLSSALEIRSLYQKLSSTVK